MNPLRTAWRLVAGISAFAVAVLVGPTAASAAPGDPTDLRLAFTHTGGNNPTYGTVVANEATIANDGPETATNVVVTVSYPAGLVVTFSYATAGTFTDSGTGVAGGTFTWTISSIASGASVGLNFGTRRAYGEALTVSGSIVSADQDDPVSGNNIDSFTLGRYEVTVAVAKTVDNPTPAVGESVVYTVGVTNEGANLARGFSVVDPLPAGLTLVSATPSDGDYDTGTGVWSGLSLPSGASATLIVTATVDVPAPITNTAAFSGLVEGGYVAVFDSTEVADRASVTINDAPSTDPTDEPSSSPPGTTPGLPQTGPRATPFIFAGGGLLVLGVALLIALRVRSRRT